MGHSRGRVFGESGSGMDDSIVGPIMEFGVMLTPTGWLVRQTTTMMKKMSTHVIDEQ